MSLNPIRLCSQALVKIGANAITSLEEETAEARVAKQLYPLVRDGLLACYPWRFALMQKRLNRLLEKPVADYTYAYQLPNDLLRIISAGTGERGKGVDYRVMRHQLHTNVPEVVLTYISRPYESMFPKFFEQALVAALAVEFCLPLTESTARQEALKKQAEESFRQAKLVDSQQAVPSAFQDFSLIEVRS